MVAGKIGAVAAAASKPAASKSTRGKKPVQLGIRWFPRFVAPMSMAWPDVEARLRSERAAAAERCRAKAALPPPDVPSDETLLRRLSRNLNGGASLAPPEEAALLPLPSSPAPSAPAAPPGESLLRRLSRHITGAISLVPPEEAAPLDISGRWKLVAIEGEPELYLKALGVSYVARKLSQAANWGVGRQQIEYKLDRDANCMEAATRVAIPVFALANDSKFPLDGGRFEMGDRLTGIFRGGCELASPDELRFGLRGPSGIDLTLRFYRRGEQLVQASHAVVDGEAIGTERVFERLAGDGPIRGGLESEVEREPHRI
jgi:hypothetical protein